MVPKTFVGQGRMRFIDPKGGMAPIGNRIITLPEDQEKARLRDPRSGFVSYAAAGQPRQGEALAETGGRNKRSLRMHSEPQRNGMCGRVDRGAWVE